MRSPWPSTPPAYSPPWGLHGGPIIIPPISHRRDGSWTPSSRRAPGASPCWCFGGGWGGTFWLPRSSVDDRGRRRRHDRTHSGVAPPQVEVIVAVFGTHASIGVIVFALTQFDPPDFARDGFRQLEEL